MKPFRNEEMLFHIRIFIWILAVFVLTGCSAIGHRRQLLALKKVGANQKNIERYIEKQESSFYVLLEVVKNKGLEVGVTKQAVINSYGDPVLSREIKDDTVVLEELLYRHPTRYFTSDRIYMYFDDKEKLTRWEYYPAD
ncbi:MAG: hypothetical protein ABIH71_07845 [Candidatus Omnitrophota bacterium]